jgi:hypothetical protein
LVLAEPEQSTALRDALHATESFASAHSLAASGNSAITPAAFDRQAKRIRDLVARGD